MASSTVRIPVRALVVSCALALGIGASAVVLPGTAHADPTLDQIQAQIDKFSSDLEKVIENYDKVGEQLKATKAAVAKLNVQLKPMQDKVEAARNRVGAVAAAAYMGSGMSTAGAILTSGSPTVAIDQLTLLNEFARAQQADIDAFSAAKARYDAESTRLDSVLKAQANQETTLAAQKASINTQLTKLDAMRQKAYGTIAEPVVSVGAPAPHLPGTAGQAVDYAYGAIGKPYVFGASGPDSYDCSGLTMAAWQSAGVSLPHNAAMQWSATTRISRSSLAPGDLVFYNGQSHVAIYVGGGMVIHAPEPGENVKKAAIDVIGSIDGYGRVNG